MIIRFAAGVLAPACLLALAAATSPATARAPGLSAPVPLVLARTSCDPDGRCYETGDPGDGYDRDPPPPPRDRYDRGGYDRGGYDDDLPPPPRRRYDPDDDDRPPPPPHRRRYDPDDNN